MSTIPFYLSDSPEKTDRWVGIAETQGDAALAYLILTDDTNKVITCSKKVCP
jgi:hypothetical protein